MKSHIVKCPCGLGQDYHQCCGRYIDEGNVPKSPEQLMRSRYTAYVKCNHDYLLQTWQENTRPKNLELDQKLDWLGLDITDCQADESDENKSQIEFSARFRSDDKVFVLHERSLFVRENGRWFYVDGEIFKKSAPDKIGRNAPCICGSGKKFKHCCG